MRRLKAFETQFTFIIKISLFLFWRRKTIKHTCRREKHRCQHCLCASVSVSDFHIVIHSCVLLFIMSKSCITATWKTKRKLGFYPVVVIVVVLSLHMACLFYYSPHLLNSVFSMLCSQNSAGTKSCKDKTGAPGGFTDSIFFVQDSGLMTTLGLDPGNLRVFTKSPLPCQLLFVNW